MKKLLALLLATALSAGAQTHGASATLTVTALPPQSLSINFAQTVHTGTPAMFGGNRFQTDATLISEILAKGITRSRNIVEIRGGGGCGIVPNTTNAIYLANIGVAGSVADPNTWSWTCFDSLQVIAAHNAGVPVILDIMAAPTWNTYSGGRYGVPNNLTVYADIVKKVYQHLVPEEVIIYNEPDYFIDLTGSPYGDQQSAYIDMYRAAAAAIRSVSSTVPIGGPDTCCSYPPDWIPAFLAASIPAANINFVDYHNYQDNGDELADGVNVYNLVQTSKPGMPVYQTEWNGSAGCEAGSRTDNDPSSPSFIGTRIINQINLGLSASYYWGLNSSTCSFFTSGVQEPLLPKTNTWLLLSTKLGLGAGNFQTKSVAINGITAGMGATNSAGQQVASVVNDTGSTLNVAVIFNNLPANGSATMNLFHTSNTLNPASAYQTSSVTISNNSVTQVVTMTPYSVTGLVLQ